ncbi:MAG: ABC transporter permease, partial [Cyanobacteriota bacterium]
MATGTVPLRETAAMAVATLKGHRLRSLLTMLGIVIGNASVITLVGLGKGAQRLADQQLHSLGPNVLFNVPGRNDTRRQRLESTQPLI